MMAGQSPFAGGMPQQGPGPGQGPSMVGGYQPLGAAQKTIVAGMAPPIMGGQMMPGGMPPQGMMPGGMPGQMPGGTPNAGFPPPGQGPNKTVLIQPSEGVVSMTQRGGQGLQAGVVQGASTLYWIVCLMIGIALGVLAYVIVLQM